MKNIFPLFLAMFFALSLFAQNRSNEHQVVILGNIADITKPDEFLAKLESRLNAFQTPFTVLLNGDIAAKKVVEGKDRLALAKRIMDLVATKELGNLIILSGDRDWSNSGKGGYKEVLAIESEIKDYKKENAYKHINWIVSKGCPGPFIEEVNESLVIIAINTQWWNHPFDKPRPADGKCDIITHRDFIEELEDAVEEYKDRNILLVGHHPFISLGNYGGYFSFGDHMNPAPVIGSFRTAYRKSIGSNLDITNSRFKPLVEGLINLFFFNNNLIYVSSHEKNQQIIMGNDNFAINSGALQKGRHVAKDPNAWFTSKEAGWIELIYREKGKVESIFVSNKDSKRNRSMTLFDSACSSASIGANPQTPVNLAYAPCFKEEEVPEKMVRAYPDLEEVIAGEEYKVSKWKQLWWGKHYRSTWTSTVKVPYLNLDTTFGGLTVYKKGGGRQTTSLKFRSSDNTVYVLRSVNKDPSKAFNYKLRMTFISDITKDQTSTEQPYGAMAVDPLLNKIDILHAHPTLYLLPNDEKLGHFQYKYGNLFGMLEENPGKKNEKGVHFGGADKILRSNELFRDLYKDHDNKVDEVEFVRARVFDILVGDWSKHEDNWKWAKYKTEHGHIYRPIPRDRDHVFSKQDGFWPYIADREWALQNIENFDYKIKGLKSLMWQARHMDRFIANEATRETWINEARFIQKSITDDDIEAAVRNMPIEIYEISGATIAKKLKQRIKDLPKYAEEYYELLAKEVEIVGSKGKEYIEIERAKDGTVTVAMHNCTKEGQKGKRSLYYRKFYPKETKEIRVFGLGGSDVFKITGDGSQKIKIRVLGGPGDDSFSETGTSKASKTLIYEKGKGTVLNLGKGAKRANYWNKNIYDYDRTRFKYHTYFPLASLDYNEYYGLTLSGGVIFTRQKYDKTGYASKHKIGAGISTEKNLNFFYHGRFHQAIKRWDILLRASAADPEFHNNFYGLGNSSKRIDDLEFANFYEISYTQYYLLTGLSREFWRKSKLEFITGIEYVKSRKLNQTTILEDETGIPGAFKTLKFLPLTAELDLDFRDKAGLPYNGTRLFVNYTNGTVLNEDYKTNKVFDYGYFESFIEYYLSSLNKRKVTLGLRFGGARGYGDIPFYKMPNLGGSNGLRGYTGERFTGDSKIYFNSELRWQILHRYTPLFPIKVGVKAFFDSGRVYYSGDDTENNKWHSGYGGGIYLVPYTEAFIISLSIGFSDEESFYPIIGIGTPLK